MKVWTGLLLFFSTGAWAAEPIPYRQSVLKHGLNASAYGEALVQRDSMLDTDMVSGRVQGGWLLTRESSMSTTLGAAYTGLLGNAQKAERGVVEYRYYGPILEIIAWQDSPVKPILSYAYGFGYFKRSADKETLDYRYSSMKMQELRLALALSLGKYEQLIIGASEQDIEHQHFEKFEKDGELYRRRGKTQEVARSYFAGFRLAAF